MMDSFGGFDPSLFFSFFSFVLSYSLSMILFGLFSLFCSVDLPDLFGLLCL